MIWIHWVIFNKLQQATLYPICYTIEPMPGRTYCCNSPGYGTHLNSVVRSLKNAAGPSLDWAVKLLFFLAVLALYVWQMSSWDEIERQKCICTEVCVIEGIRINYCEHGRLYLSQYLLILFQYPLHASKSILHAFDSNHKTEGIYAGMQLIKCACW